MATKKKFPHMAITLTHDEAMVLASVLTNVGGDPKGKRMHVDTVLAKLSALGIRTTGDDVTISMTI